MTDAMYQLLYLIESVVGIIFKVMLLILIAKFVKEVKNDSQYKQSKNR